MQIIIPIGVVKTFDQSLNINQPTDKLSLQASQYYGAHLIHGL